MSIFLPVPLARRCVPLTVVALSEQQFQCLAPTAHGLIEHYSVLYMLVPKYLPADFLEEPQFDTFVHSTFGPLVGLQPHVLGVLGAALVRVLLQVG